MDGETEIRTYDFVQAHFLPALEKMGYRVLSSDEQKTMREGDETAVLLTTVLREQLIKVNTVEVNSVKEVRFSHEEIEAGIKALQTIVMQREYLLACREVYELITQGKVFRQNIGAGYLSFTMHYIDWNNPLQNVWHVAKTFCVQEGKRKYYLDYVLFVNGIPLCVIEWSDVAWREGVEMAIQQQVAYQKTEGTRDLYAYAQLLLAVAGNTVKCATNDLRARIWTEWHELHGGDGNEEPVSLLALCEPVRLLELVYRFILFQGKEKMLARYYHYFIVKKVLEQIAQRREGGVIYQPTGSGKALTMLLLTRAIRMDERIRNPKIFWIADRMDIDRQLTELMVRCGVPFISADTGRSLANLLQSDHDVVVTTTLQKFLTAVVAVRKPLESADIFVILDEGQRSQLGDMGYRLGRILPNACFLAFTDIPVIEERIKQRFGEVIASYSFGMAVKDRVVLPVLYEKRYLPEEICNEEERIEKIGEDIAAHFECYYKGTDSKGLVVCLDQREAIKYKAVFDRLGKLSAEVIPGSSKEDGCEERVFKRERSDLLRRFQEDMTPEVLIISKRSFAGFDISCSVLYLTSQVGDKTYIQMAGRLSRIYGAKSQGRLIDYQAFSFESLKKPEAIRRKNSDVLIQSVETVFYRLDRIRTEIWKQIGGIPEYGQDLRKLGDTFRNAARRITFYTCLDNYEDDLRKVSDGCFGEDKKEKIRQYQADFQLFVQLRNILLRRFAEQFPKEELVDKVSDLPDKMLAWAVMADAHVFQHEMEEAGGLLAQADTLAYRLKRGVERSNSLELIYREKVVKILNEIFACFEKNGDAWEYVNRVLRLRLQLLNSLQVEKLPEDSVLSAYYGVLQRLFVGEEKAGELTGEVVLETDRIVRKNIYEDGKIIVDWQRKDMVINGLKRELVDCLIVFLSAGNRRKISYEEIYAVVELCVGKAKMGNYGNE